MQIILPKFEIVQMPDPEKVLSILEMAGRICYKSTRPVSQKSAAPFVTKIIFADHHSVLEHQSISVHFTCDRGVSHELVRHRLASFSQESTRYAGRQRELTFIKPVFWGPNSLQYQKWEAAMAYSESQYYELLNMGCSPQEARSVLPNSLKTELIMTANIREWRHVLKLRCSKNAHPQMREIMQPLLNTLIANFSPLFDDIGERFF